MSIHADWLGMLQPEGLVVSLHALQDVPLTRQGAAAHAELREACADGLPDLDTLQTLLDWPERRVVADTERWRTDLPDLQATLQPDRVVVDRDGSPVLFVRWTEHDPDRAPGDSPWPATRQERLERLLIDQGVPAGLMVTSSMVRLTYAPAGEASGRLSFPIEALCAADGRILVDALHLLLGRDRLFVAPKEERLLPLLKRSRSEQDRVTAALARQVEDALRLLLVGFDAAGVRAEPEELYDALCAVLLRLIFLLYAEDRGLLPVEHPLYARSYSVLGLAERLRADRVLHGAMDRRFGAWSQLLTLFRLVYDGGEHHGLALPPRKGQLFFPDAHPLLEGRHRPGWKTDTAKPPAISDDAVEQVLHKLLHLDGQRLSYRNLEVEQIGSVYENLMGFRVQRVVGPSVQLKPDGDVVDLVGLRDAEDRYGWLAEQLPETRSKLSKLFPEVSGVPLTEDRDADLDALQAALGPRLAADAQRLQVGRHVLVPGPERRHSGSHYTPRSLTEPIVQHALEPVLGGRPSSERILGLKVCDPAMGSGAFLAETCRFLGRQLVAAWTREGTVPQAVDPEVVARRQVAERCLYGVDKNARAVQLARLSLWLVTSAAELPFTFVDHALREGDALIGCTVKQIAAFDLHPGRQISVMQPYMEAAMGSAARMRARIVAEGTFEQKADYLRTAEDETWDERRVGDLLVAALWKGGKKSALTKRVARMQSIAQSWYPNQKGRPMHADADALLEELDLRPFHWELEYPEVFGRDRPGFDAVVGNPPFGGKNTILDSNGSGYIKLLQQFWPHGHGNADLAAWFFVRATDLLREDGCFGLVSTNTIAQGNTRETGLQHLLDRGLSLYRAIVDMRWPVRGAAVTVSIVHARRGAWSGPIVRDGDVVEVLNSALEAREELPDPVKLAANANKSFIGNYVLGKGFVLTPDEAAALIETDPANAEVVRPYLGGQELNSDPELMYSRWVIDFAERDLEACAAWPTPLDIVRQKVKPERDKNNRKRRREIWWQFAETAPGLRKALAGLGGPGSPGRCLGLARVSKYLLVSFLPTHWVYTDMVVVLALSGHDDFAVLQSRVHQHWAHTLGSSMKTDPRYTPSRCFETFPFPRVETEGRVALARAGRTFYEHRLAVMKDRQEGMTQVTNRLHDPHEHSDDIQSLRELRDAMDAAVLAAYGWSDLDPDDKDSILTWLRKLNAARAAEEAQGT